MEFYKDERIAEAIKTAIQDFGKKNNLNGMDYFAEKLAQVEGVTEVRGMGLMLGADLEEGIDAHKVVAQGLEEGFLLNATGSNTLRFLPPLIVTETEIDKLIDALPGMIAAVRE